MAHYRNKKAPFCGAFLFLVALVNTIEQQEQQLNLQQQQLNLQQQQFLQQLQQPQLCQ
jgi:hypothetical protein